MLKAILVDDEAHCIERLQNLIVNHCDDDVEILAVATDIDKAFLLINELKPDIVFLDVQIGTQTGFELLQKFSKVDFSVIFTTAHEQYAVRAFKFSATDYLMKPIIAEELTDAVSKVLNIQKDKDRDMDIRMLLHNLHHELKPGNKKIAIPTLTGYHLIQVEDIIRCQSDVNYTIVHFTNQPKVVVSKTLREFENMLEPHGFIRLHHSHLVNPAYIKEYHKGKGGYVILNDKSEIEVSVRKKEVLMQALGLR